MKNTTANTVFPKLTKLEHDILNHRLEVPDCIADALENDFPDDDIGGACSLLMCGTYDGSPLSRAVLQDAIEGSTYYGTTIGNGSPQHEAAVYRAGCSLAKKIGNLIGTNLVYPDH